MAITICKGCGTQVSDRAGFCPKCGEPVAAPKLPPPEEPAPITTRRCPRCGKPIPAISRACSECREPLALKANPELDRMRWNFLLACGFLLAAVAAILWLGLRLRAREAELAARDLALKSQVDRARALEAAKFTVTPEKGLRLFEGASQEIRDYSFMPGVSLRVEERTYDGRPKAMYTFGGCYDSLEVDTANIDKDSAFWRGKDQMESEILALLLRQVRRQADWTHGDVSAPTHSHPAIGYLFHPSGMLTVVVAQSRENPARYNVKYSLCIMSSTVSGSSSGFPQCLQPDPVVRPGPIAARY